MAFADDLASDLAAVFFGDEFAVAGTLDGAPVRVIFDRAVQPDPVGGGIAAGTPQALIASASLPAAFSGKTLVLPQGSFTIRNAYADGVGTTLLELAVA